MKKYIYTAERQKALDILETYTKHCPNCKNEYIQEINNGKDIFDLGDKRFWVHYCEADDNLHSEEIFYCPYCGIFLPKSTDKTLGD